jgi:2-polyprenyl-3-methyl-5-hydroxy-6-metoxy-1,4-benzoquinol methylase
MQAASALITMVLHHAGDPAEILRNIVRFVPPGALVVIGELHPMGPCAEGSAVQIPGGSREGSGMV